MTTTAPMLRFPNHDEHPTTPMLKIPPDYSTSGVSGSLSGLDVQQFSMWLSRICIVRLCWRCLDLARDHEKGFSQAGET